MAICASLPLSLPKRRDVTNAVRLVAFDCSYDGSAFTCHSDPLRTAHAALPSPSHLRYTFRSIQRAGILSWVGEASGRGRGDQHPCQNAAGAEGIIPARSEARGSRSALFLHLLCA
jgi:hypothetical protein